MKANVFLFLVAVLFPSDVLSSNNSVEQSFKQLDRNGDGYINMQEAEGHLDILRQWALIDEDTDGRLEMIEFSAFESPQALTYEPAVDPDDVDPGAELAR